MTTAPERETAAEHAAPPPDPAAGDSIGVDIGGTSTRVVVFGPHGDVHRRSVTPTPVGPDALVGHLVRELDGAVAAAFAPTGAGPVSIGVGIPGSVVGGTVAMAINLGIDHPVDLADLLATRYGVPVRVENDVNAAALGVHAHLGHAAPASLTYLSIGTGLAAGTVVDGRLVRGVTGAAGEIGHIALPGREEVCRCGQTGCLEAIVSGRAMIERMDATGLGGTVVDLWDAADASDVTARAIRDDVVATLAWACRMTGMLLDVERIVLGGGVGVALGDRLAHAVADSLRAIEAHSTLLGTMGHSARVTTAPADTELGALGADRSARRAATPGAAP
jgi:predicted NBD/HSP70 family sugar kinase